MENISDNANMQLSHTKSIKRRLLAGKLRFETENGLPRITSYQIKKHFDEENFPVTIPTIDKILDVESNVASVNTTIVVKLCKWWDIDLSYVFALPEDKTVLTPNSHYGSPFKQLDDPYYWGDFTCYMLRIAYASESNGYTTKGDTLRKNDSLVTCKLRIENVNNSVIAKMKIYNTSLPSDDETFDDKHTMTATPIYLSQSNNVLINFESRHGKYYTLMFDYQVFYNKPMYYREAVLLTSTANNSARPLVSKMLILRNPVDSVYHDYVLGLLSLNVNNIIISEDKLNRLAEEIPEIAQFVKDFARYMPLYKRPFYVIPENLIDVNPNASMSIIEMKKILLLLRNHSYSLAQIEFGDDERAHVVAKEIQKYITVETE